jgi:uncharacterized protein (TIGR00251 family)
MSQPEPIFPALEPNTNGPGICLRIKVVPGASRDKVVGMLGDRLKVAVSAPPEAGKANKAVCKLLSAVLGLPPRDVTVTAGHAQPTKTLAVTGISLEQAAQRLASKMVK